jgi:hypothetical protein
MSHDSKQLYVEAILRDLINLLPNAYNKETTDTNYYKILRSLAYELADANIEMDNIRANQSLETVTPEMMYNNFGTLVKLSKRPEWDYEQYRTIIKGVTQSLLKGPTKQSLVDALKLFTQFDVNVYELFKDKDKVDPQVYKGYNPKFTFLIEIEKPIEIAADYDILLRDLNYIVNIIKPAHTIGINIITLVGKENYKEYYAIDRKIDEIKNFYINLQIDQKVNSLANEYFLKKANELSNSEQIPLEDAIDKLRMQSNGMTQSNYLDAISALAADRYTSYLVSLETNEISYKDLDDFTIEATHELLGQIEKDYLDGLKNQIFDVGNGSLTSIDLERKIIDTKEELIYQNSIAEHPLDLTQDEWRDRAVALLKDSAFNDYILEQLGGIDTIKNNCSTLAEQFRVQLDLLFSTTRAYLGMDKYTISATNNFTEGTFGWKHLSDPGVFMTSISMDGSKIGGADVLGPRYALYDKYRMKYDQLYKEVDILRMPRTPMQLNNGGRLVDDDPSRLNNNKIVPDPVPDDYSVALELKGEVVDTKSIPHVEAREHALIEDKFVSSKMKELGLFQLDEGVLGQNVLGGIGDEDSYDDLDVVHEELSEPGQIFTQFTNFQLNNSLLDSTSDTVTYQRRDIVEIDAGIRNETYDKASEHFEGYTMDEEETEDFLLLKFSGFFMLNDSLVNDGLVGPDFDNEFIDEVTLEENETIDTKNKQNIVLTPLLDLGETYNTTTKVIDSWIQDIGKSIEEDPFNAVSDVTSQEQLSNEMIRTDFIGSVSSNETLSSETINTKNFKDETLTMIVEDYNEEQYSMLGEGLFSLNDDELNSDVSLISTNTSFNVYDIKADSNTENLDVLNKVTALGSATLEGGNSETYLTGSKVTDNGTFEFGGNENFNTTPMFTFGLTPLNGQIGLSRKIVDVSNELLNNETYTTTSRVTEYVEMVAR